jgi:uncharacterized phage-associated protein
MSKISIFDVAKYILETKGQMTAMKLQKLVYYVKAWYMVWHEEELFEESFEAWVNGAVSPRLYLKHRGMFKVDKTLFRNANSDIIKEEQREIIDKVVNFYSKYTAQQLSDLNHQEDPWKIARGDTSLFEKCSNEITISSMHEYYSGIAKNG